MPEASIEYFFSDCLRKFALLLSLFQKDLSHFYVLFDSIPILLHLFVHIREITDGTQLFPCVEPISGVQLLGQFMAIVATLVFNIQKHIYWITSLRSVFVKFGFPSVMVMGTANRALLNNQIPQKCSGFIVSCTISPWKQIMMLLLVLFHLFGKVSVCKRQKLLQKVFYVVIFIVKSKQCTGERCQHRQYIVHLVQTDFKQGGHHYSFSFRPWTLLSPQSGYGSLPSG